LTLITTLLLIAIGWSACAAQARRAVKGAKAPETFSDDNFRPEELAKLAVLAATDVRGQQIQSDRQRLVEDIFVQALLARGHVVVARSDIRSVLTEQQLAKSGLTDDNAVAVGKLMNVPAVLVVQITECALETQRDPKTRSQTQIAQATVGARLINVETGGIWWQGTHSLSDTVTVKSELVLVLAQLTERLARAFPQKSPDKSRFDLEAIDKLALVMLGDSRKPRRGAPPVTADQQRLNQERLVEDKLGILLGKKGYAQVSRSDLEAVMQEKRFQESGLTEEDVSALGKLLNIPAVLVVRITAYESEEFQKKPGSRASPRATMATAALGARLVSVETGEVLWCRTDIESEEVKSRLETSDILSKAVKKIADALPARGSSKKSR
jgi:curli biogenesis system outer membrane secretion channel CsgG